MSINFLRYNFGLGISLIPIYEEPDTKIAGSGVSGKSELTLLANRENINRV
jgi:hypothetical protein